MDWGGFCGLPLMRSPGIPFCRVERSFFAAAAATWREEEVLSVQPHKGAFLMKLKGIDTMEEAESLRGRPSMWKSDRLERKSEDEFFWHEIIGLEVYLKTGAYVGEVENILSTGGNDIYVVRHGESEVLDPRGPRGGGGDRSSKRENGHFGCGGTA